MVDLGPCDRVCSSRPGLTVGPPVWTAPSRGLQALEGQQGKILDCPAWGEGGREGGRKGGREEGREGGRKGGREEKREEEREG